MRFTLHELAHLTGGTVLRSPSRPIPVQPVSRHRRLFPEACYFPIRRLHDAAEEEHYLQEKKPAVVVISRDRQGEIPLHLVPDAGIIACRSPWRSYFQVAAAARDKAASLVVGITGSTGKSSTTEFLSTALSGHFRVLTNEGGHNTCLDCCDLLLGMDGTEREAVVVEMGFDRIGDVRRMAKTARPQLGIITNVSEAHLAGANNDWASVIREKGRLGEYIPAGGCLIINADDPGCRRLPTATYACDIKTYGYDPGADVRLSNVYSSETGLRLTVDCFGHKLDVVLRVFGEWQAANVAAAVLAAHLVGIPLAEVRDALAAKPPPSHRFYIYRFDRGLTVIDDTFNASVASMERGLYGGARLAGRRRKIAFLGGVKRLGTRGRELHFRLGQTVARLGYEHVVFIRRRYGEGFIEGLVAGGLGQEKITTLQQYEEAPDAIMPLLGPDTLLYCKAENAGPEVNMVLQRLQQAGWQLQL